MRVSDLIANNPVPRVSPDSPLPETVIEMTSKLMGATVVVNPDGTIYGIITDGDLRRMLASKKPVNGVFARDICSRSPRQINPDALAVEALDLMRKNDITHLVVSENNHYIGILHLHDLVKEGLI
jgi:arabinose-5-phosphate isomerase